MDKVALRKESVDRNYKERPGQKARPKSLSARRAWIEMKSSIEEVSKYVVALRKESVDRNDVLAVAAVLELVALRKESVDRNHIRHTTSPRPSSRSPQGERG